MQTWCARCSISSIHCKISSREDSFCDGFTRVTVEFNPDLLRVRVEKVVLALDDADLLGVSFTVPILWLSPEIPRANSTGAALLVTS